LLTRNVCEITVPLAYSVTIYFDVFSLTWIVVFAVKSETAASVLYPDYALRAGRSGDRIPVGARLSASVQPGPETHPVSYTKGTGLFPWVKRPKRGVHHPHHLTPRLKKDSAILLLPLRALVICSRVKFTFTFAYARSSFARNVSSYLSLYAVS